MSTTITSTIALLFLLLILPLAWFFYSKKRDSWQTSSNNGRETNNQQRRNPKRKGKRRKNKTRAKKGSSKDTSSIQNNDLPSTRPSVSFVALDCEMVGIGRQGINSMLARCSLVTISEDNSNVEGDDDDNDVKVTPRINVLYDVYVKPTKNITDYRTEYSGITSDHLARDDAVTFEVCRSKVISMLKPTEDRVVVLVGHALKNDFQVLRYWHPSSLVRDTACYKPFMSPVRKRFFPKKLSFLAEEHLGIKIQNNNCEFDINFGDHGSVGEDEHEEGHSSIEDSAAALLLYKKVSKKWEEKLNHPLNQRRRNWI